MRQVIIAQQQWTSILFILTRVISLEYGSQRRHTFYGACTHFW